MVASKRARRQSFVLRDETYFVDVAVQFSPPVLLTDRLDDLVGFCTDLGTEVSERVLLPTLVVKLVLEKLDLVFEGFVLLSESFDSMLSLPTHSLGLELT